MNPSNQFTAYNFHLIELKFGSLTLDISPLGRSEPDFSISIQGRCGARLLRYLNRFTGYSIHQIELKFGGMILDISPHNLTERGLSISSQKVLRGGRAS